MDQRLVQAQLSTNRALISEAEELTFIYKEIMKAHVEHERYSLAKEAQKSYRKYKARVKVLTELQKALKYDIALEVAEDRIMRNVIIFS